MISGDNPPKYCRWCGTRMPAPGMHEGSFKSETDCELEAVKSKLATTELMLAQRNEQIAARIRELAAAEQGWNKCDDAWEAEVKGMEAENAALQSRLDAIRSGLNDALVHNQGGAITDADSMSTIHELFYQWFQRKDVERQEIK
jgi:predicted  nucleic acid-binding Zn-ribbon protein